MHVEKKAGTRPTLNILDALSEAADLLCARLQAAGCALYLKEGEGFKVCYPEGCGVKDGLGRIPVPRTSFDGYLALDPDHWPERSRRDYSEAGWLTLNGPQGACALALIWWENTPELPAEHDLRAVSEEVGGRLETAQLFVHVERAKRQWEATVDALREAIALVDIKTGRLLRANWALARQLGKTPGDLVGADLNEDVLAPLGMRGEHLINFAAGSSEIEVEARAMTWRVVQHSLEESGAGVVILEDVTQRHRSHKELVRAHRKIQESMERLRSTQAQLVQSEKMAAVGQLVSGVAHELNNPLTSVLGFAQLLERTHDDAKRQTFVETIAKEAERARKIVQNLLTFARKRKPEKLPLCVNDVVLRTLDLKAYEMRVSGVEVVTELASDLPRTAGDFQQLQQVLLNLLHNAVQAVLSAGRQGEIRIRTRVREEGEPGEPGIETPSLILEVEDNGTGIPEGHLNRIFEPFYTTKEVGEGTGLGLSLAYGIVQEHGGSIRAENVESAGAKFVLEIPVVEILEDRAVFSTKKPVGVQIPARRILVVDDEEPIRTMLQELLEGDGHNVCTAGDGQLALQTLDEGDGFDLILTDLKMPVLDGYDLYHQLRQRFPNLAERVVFITGDTVSQETLNFLIRAGNPYLPKPLNLSRLREVVSSVPH